MNEVIAACLSAEDLPAIQRLALDDSCEVVAVAMDLGDGAGLRALHAAARAAGAARGHAHVLEARAELATTR